VLRHTSMRILFILAVLTVVSACSTARKQCEVWQREGFMFSTPESCVKCIKRLGWVDRDAIRGCALGMDAADLTTLNKD